MIHSLPTRKKIIYFVSTLIVISALTLTGLLFFHKSHSNFLPPSGIKQDIQSKKEEDSELQTYLLQQKTPIHDNYFTMTYNTNTYSFEVGLKGNYDQSKRIFLDWVTKNRFNEIPKEKFIFTKQ
jgi:hypothetical protein